jgi:hypothetical protein
VRVDLDEDAFMRSNMHPNAASHRKVAEAIETALGDAHIAAR